MSILHKELFKRQGILEIEMLFEKAGAKSYGVAVEESAENCSQLDAFKMPEPEEDKGQNNAYNAADAVVSRFEFCDAYIKFSGKLLNEQFVCFRGNIGVEEHRNANGANKHTDDEKCYFCGYTDFSRESNERYGTVKSKAVYNSRYKREKIGKLEAAKEYGHKNEKHCLKRIFCHAEGEEGEYFRKLQMQDICGGNNHGHTEICFFHKRGSKGKGYDAD